MSERIIIQITGEAGAGKTDVCSHLAEEYDFGVVLVSDIIRSFARSRNLVLGPRADYLDAHRQMKEELGVDIVATAILAEPNSRLCVDRIRVKNDVERLRRASGGTSKVIALHCPPEQRFARAVIRNSGMDRLTSHRYCLYIQSSCKRQCQNTSSRHRFLA